jgi:hypothetical protein
LAEADKVVAYKNNVVDLVEFLKSQRENTLENGERMYRRMDPLHSYNLRSAMNEMTQFFAKLQ